ncbi:L-amino acid N-acyltransferase YncA [Microbacterium sp. SORGH_AS 1204]|uniref:GNAT family N-acetyltransferase n=1 Tax=Microbacterium sp. SORGH_AS_1204 TaxID=3041785 RepID=UPI0027936F31|nr:GNAT family N-acetyltransferase [Microbacterium sp. SORGH_AS_1204]MDQ1138327.1 L-amino acid N-acyltransferase YncA [Microbacterium sp. SORGH_AS_1204]
MTALTIRPMRADDWPSVESIYRDGITTGNATFEAEPPSWQDFDRGKLAVGRLVAVDGDDVAGWVAASPVSTREVYRGVVEHSVYVSQHALGRRVGSDLVSAFLRDADAAGIWTVQSSIFPENPASLTLHERAGFRRVGTRERIALMTYGPWAGQWRDTVLIERRRPQ